MDPGNTRTAARSRPALVGHTLALSGDHAGAQAVLHDLLERQRAGDYVAPTEPAAILIGLGRTAEALDWLELHEQDPGARIFRKVDPIFDPVRSDARFGALLKRVRLE